MNSTQDKRLAPLKAKKLIKEVVFEFYSKAIVDEFLSYHFRKIPHFIQHLEGIEIFWHRQFNLEVEKDSKAIKNLIEAHLHLHIKKGEVGRWVTLFLQTLDHFKQKSIHQNQDQELVFLKLWENKIDHFKKIFLESHLLFTGR